MGKSGGGAAPVTMTQPEYDRQVAWQRQQLDAINDPSMRRDRRVFDGPGPQYGAPPAIEEPTPAEPVSPAEPAPPSPTETLLTRMTEQLTALTERSQQQEQVYQDQLRQQQNLFTTSLLNQTPMFQDQPMRDRFADMWRGRTQAEAQAEAFADRYIEEELSRAALQGRSLEFSPEQRADIISSRFADIWGEADEAEFQSLYGQYGGGRSLRYQRGQAGEFDADTSARLAVLPRRSMLTSDEDVEILGAATVLGG